MLLYLMYRTLVCKKKIKEYEEELYNNGLYNLRTVWKIRYYMERKNKID